MKTTPPTTTPLTPGPLRRRPPVALTVAGTDSGGGAGVAADLRTFAACGVWGTMAVTAVTAQSSLGVARVGPLAPELVRAQIESVAGDMGVDALKTGMLGTGEVAHAVAEAVRDLALAPLVVDPVVESSSGHRLLDNDGLAVLRRELLPLAAVVTPNLAEAALLAGVDPPGVERDGATARQTVEALARAVLSLGPGAVLVTGGHLVEPGGAEGSPDSPDCLVVRGEEPLWIEGERIATSDTHGTGCVLSAALTARLALGDDLPDAARAAKAVVSRALRCAVALGAGPGSVDPLGL
ncbi:MAG: bifunctional hydroxymethylpyrimidine kinase/phosphomethylpyrimidine kinase [Actinobacteria bacterium]|nr:MAG: bifunctional hydroxymethylpyrimidine kinase/phosphomethylpyrimidine kinase [Actinomycetota bacterium]